MEGNKVNMKKSRAILFLLLCSIFLGACTLTNTVKNKRNENSKKENGDGYDIGDEVTFGNDEACNTWTVLDRSNDGSVLLYCNDIVHNSSYFYGPDDTYDVSFLNVWMNREYKGYYFSDIEIQSMRGDIFVLSKQEIEKYLPKKKDRMIPSKSCYWLYYWDASAYNYDGVDERGNITQFQNISHIGIRPAVWIYPNKLSDENASKIDSNLEVGDTVYFGKYEIDDVEGNELNAIPWTVLSIEDGRALLISEKLLEERWFWAGDDYSITTWDVSQIREFLNGEFYTNTFTKEEKNQILLTTVTNPVISLPYGNRTESSGDTEDYVFLLSKEEVELYMPQEYDRKAYPTPWLVKTRNTINDSTQSWWLRSFYNNECTYFVSTNGIIRGTSNQANHICVRPAMWVKVN